MHFDRKVNQILQKKGRIWSDEVQKNYVKDSKLSKKPDVFTGWTWLWIITDSVLHLQVKKLKNLLSNNKQIKQNILEFYLLFKQVFVCSATLLATCKMSTSFKLLPDKWDIETVTEHVIIHYRWVFVMFLLPLSFLYDIYHAFRSFIVFKLNSAPSKHLQKVQKVQKQVRNWIESGSSQPMCTARPGWQTISPQNMDYKKKMSQISVNLVDILEIDPNKR